jgi:uncharacterized OB-fold protein
MQSIDLVMLGGSDTSRGTHGLAEQFRATVHAHKVAVAQHCDSCGTSQFPPMLGCPVCGSSDLSWVSCGDAGTVGTFVTVHTADATPSMSIPRRLRAHAPYTSVYVVPDAVPGVRVPALMIGSQQSQLRIGSPVTLEVSDELGLLANLSQ